MNQRTQRQAAGRVLSAKNERRIRDADALLTDVLAELADEHEEETMSSDIDRSYNKLISALRRTAKADDYNDQDAKFVRMMIPHHEAAVEMAEQQIKDGENVEIVDLAKAVKRAQNEEIDGMRQWLKDRDLDEDGGGKKKPMRM